MKDSLSSKKAGSMRQSALQNDSLCARPARGKRPGSQPVIPPAPCKLAAEIETIYETTREALFMVRIDGDGFRYVKHNDAHRRQTGINDIEGKSPVELIGPDAGRKVTENYTRCITQGGTISYEETLTLPTGTRIWHTTLTPVFEAGKPVYIVGSSRDITRERQQNEEMQQLLRRNECLVKILQNDTASLTEYLDFVLRQMLALTDSVRGYIHVYDESAKVFMRSVHHTSARPGNLYGHCIGTCPHCTAGLRQGRPLRLNSLPDGLHHGACCSGARRCLCVPVMSGGQLIAVICMADKESDYNEMDELHLGILANTVWQSIVRKRNQEMLAKLPQQVPGGIYQYLMYPDGSYLFPFASAGIHDVLELKPEDIQRDPGLPFARIHPGDHSRILVSVQRSFQSLSLWDETFRVVLPSRGTLWLHGQARPERRLDGAVLWHGYLRDITEHIRLQQQLENQKEQFELALRGSRDGIWDWNVRSNLFYLSVKGKEQLGYADHELPSRVTTLARLIHTDDRHSFTEKMKRYLAGDLDSFSVECRMRHKDGCLRWIWVRGEALRDVRGRAYRMAGSMTDITGLRQAERALAHSHGLMRHVIERSPSGVAIHDRDLNYMYVSQRYVEHYQLVGQNIIGRHHYDVFPDLPQRWREVHQRCLRGEILRSDGDELFVRADGRADWVTWECHPWYEGDGVVGGIIVYTDVINDRKALELTIRSEREQLRTTLLSVGDGIISTDIQGRITVMNPVAEMLTGWPQREALGRSVEDVFRVVSELNHKAVASPVRAALASGSIVGMENHTLLIARDGRETPIEDSAAPIRDEHGGISGVVIVFRDCTEKKEKQSQIEHLSFNDHLTGLYNRRYMEDALKRLDSEPNLPLTIIVLDVNGLKLTNDAFGHEMGDRLLRRVAGILRQCCRTSDILCRTGGDEFAILLPRTSAGQAELIRNRITEAAGNVRMDSVIVSMAIGYAVKERVEQPVMETLREADNRMYRNKVKYGRTMRSQTIETVLRNLNTKYDEEQIHTERVSQYCERIARGLGLSTREIEDIRIAGVLHDIGKIMVPPELLNKATPLTPDERFAIRRHPEIGYQILKSVDEYAPLAEAVLHHHERWDGSGYPAGLTQCEIPLQARIIAVADAYEAMTARRSYQPCKSPAEARLELLRCAGTQFDPDIVRLFVDSIL